MKKDQGVSEGQREKDTCTNAYLERHTWTTCGLVFNSRIPNNSYNNSCPYEAQMEKGEKEVQLNTATERVKFLPAMTMVITNSQQINLAHG